mmetsp:Transcript_97011/g.274090  ORF Transcript_97011/g.274090 Transcript_97011/m.274090 type:complete len:360 (+) Transcript_97011:100-1179(+)
MSCENATAEPTTSGIVDIVAASSTITFVVEAEDEIGKTYRWSTALARSAPLKDLARLWGDDHSVPEGAVGFLRADDRAVDLEKTPAGNGWVVVDEAVIYAVPLDEHYAEGGHTRGASGGAEAFTSPTPSGEALVPEQGEATAREGRQEAAPEKRKAAACGGGQAAGPNKRGRPPKAKAADAAGGGSDAAEATPRTNAAESTEPSASSTQAKAESSAAESTATRPETAKEGCDDDPTPVASGGRKKTGSGTSRGSGSSRGRGRGAAAASGGAAACKGAAPPAETSGGAAGNRLSGSGNEPQPTGTERIKYIQENPKKPGSSGWSRYEKYKHSKTPDEAMANGAAKGDMAYDWKKGFYRRA